MKFDNLNPIYYFINIDKKKSNSNNNEVFNK